MSFPGEKKCPSDVHLCRLEGLGRLVCQQRWERRKAKAVSSFDMSGRNSVRGWPDLINKGFVYFEERHLYFYEERTSLDICCFQDGSEYNDFWKLPLKLLEAVKQDSLFGSFSLNLYVFLNVTIFSIYVLLRDSARFLWYLLVLYGVEYISPNTGGRINVGTSSLCLCLRTAWWL